MRTSITLAILLTSCTTISISVSRRAEPPTSGRSASAQDLPQPITLPRSPLLNRFDLFEAPDEDVREDFMGFQDYFKRADLAGCDESQEAAGQEMASQRTAIRSGSALSDPDPIWARACCEEVTRAQHLLKWLDAPSQGAVRPGTSTSISQPMISLLHFTDVQIREARAKLLDERQSKGLDRIVDSFEHDFQQELHIDVMFEALVQTFNETSRHAAQQRSHWFYQPRFAIHTGDAIDAGLLSEFMVFRNIMNDLRSYGDSDSEGSLPWLNVLGNHDAFAFGNFVPGDNVCTSTLIDGTRSELSRAWYWPALSLISQANWYLEPSLDLRECRGCSDRFLASRGLGPEFIKQFVEAHTEPNRSCLDGGTCTANHGFDWNLDSNGRALGYYRFELPMEGGGRFRGIVLNTDDFGDVPLSKRGGEGGWIGETQLQWLHKELTQDLENTVVVVFAHHTIHTIRLEGNRLKLAAELLGAASDGRLIGYIVGHNHDHDVRLLTCRSRELTTTGRGREQLDRTCKRLSEMPRQRGVKTHGIWQIETASVIGFPQEGRVITLRRLSDRIGFLELMPFHHTFLLDGHTPFRSLLAEAEQGAHRDVCRRGECVAGKPLRRDGASGAVRLFVPLPSLPSPRDPQPDRPPPACRALTK